MAVLPWSRLAWGGLLGVFAAPLTLAGLWLVYYGLSPAGDWAALPPTLLFAVVTTIGPFIHGSFIYLGENVQLLYAVNDDARPLVIDVLTRQQTVMVICYAVLFACGIVASIWFSAAVALGYTRFPVWLAAINPVSVTLAWLALKRLLPQVVVNHTEGAAFNIAYVIFFALMTAALW
jgi:hypothetical protein